VFYVMIALTTIARQSACSPCCSGVRWRMWPSLA
jgi:hypothetical protein